MSEPHGSNDIVSGCNIITQYPDEEFTFTWKETNFSRIFNTVRAQFKTFSGTTTWELRLIPTRCSYDVKLVRCFEGESIKVEYTCSVFTDEGIIKRHGTMLFNQIFDHCKIMESYEPIHFKNDVFNLKCSLEIRDQCLTNVITYGASELMYFKQLSCHMRDLFEKQEHCDLTMAVAQDKIQVHKSILCARSPVFNKMFQSTMLETESKEIQISDIDFNILKDFLVYLYSGELPDLNWSNALQLYYAADKYEIISLWESCSDFVGLNLDVDKVCDVLKLTDMHRVEKLKKCAMYYAQIHSSAIKSTEHWQDLLRTHPKLAVETFP